MSKDYKKEIGSGHKTKYLHTFFPQSNKDAGHDEKSDSRQHMKKLSLPFGKSSKEPAVAQTGKMILQKPGSFWGGIPLGSRNILEDKLEEVRVKDQLQEEARQERLNKEKGWFTDAKESATSLKQDNDPWYTADIWGDDLPVEAVEECILLASNTVSESKETQRKSENYPSIDMILREDENSFLNCLEELSSLENLTSNEITKSKIETNAIFAPFKEFKSKVRQESAIKSANRAQVESSSQQINRLNTHSLGVQKYLKSMKQNKKPQWEPVIQKSKPYPLFPEHKNRTSKENTYNSLSKLSPSQRKLEKPTRSMPSSSSSQAFTTEWLRNQLEKVNVEYTVLKKNMQTKDGESKLLREKLRTSQQQLEKIKQEKTNEMEALKKSLEAKVKELEKKLESTKTQMIFKAKEAESSFGKYNERKVSFDRHSSVAAIKCNVPKASLDLSFKQFIYGENRPGEVSSQVQTVLAESSDLQCLSTLEEHRDVSSKTSDLEKQACSTPLRDETNVGDQGDVDMFNDDDDDDMILNLPCLDHLLPPKTGRVASSDEDLVSKDLARYRNLISKDDDHNIESISVITEELKTCFINKKKKIGDDFVTGKGTFLSIMLLPEIEEEVVPEMNFVIPPDQPYICRKVLFNDVHEQPAENYKMTRPTLKEVWQIPLQGFVPAKERTTDRRHKFEEVPLEPALADVLMSSDRFFTPLTGCLPLVLQLIEIPYWDWSIFDTVTLKILEHVRKMAVEVYVAVGDPRRRSAMITVRDREEKVINECLDYTEMSKKFSILSAERWKDEVHIDMRRGLGVITQICALDYRLIMHLLDPRILTATRTMNPFSRRKESTDITGRNQQSTFDIDNLAAQCSTSEEMATLTETRKDDSVSEYMDILMKKWGETLQSSSCSKKELNEMLQFESYLNNLIPLPEETEDSYRCRVALEYNDGLSETQLHILNKRVEELLSKGEVQPWKPMEEPIEGSQKKEDSLTAVVSKQNCEIPKISEVIVKEGRTDADKDKPITKTFLKNIGFTTLIKQHEVVNEVPMEEQKIAWEKIVNKVEEEIDNIKRAKHECVTTPVESEPVPIFSRLLGTPKPQWEVVMDNTITATDNPEELDLSKETVCVSRYEQEFINKIYSALEQMKSMVEDSAKSPVEEDDNSSNSDGGSPAASKRKLVDSDEDSDYAECEGKSILCSLRGSPPMKKRDISVGAAKEDLKAGPSNAIQSPVVADIDPLDKDMMKQDVLDEVMVEDIKAGPSNAIQSPVVADVGPLNKDMIIPKSWKKEAFKKADIAPLKNTSGIELSDNAQDILNKEMEMEIDKLFAQPSKVTSEKKVNETEECASSEDIPSTEPITPSIQKNEDDSLYESNNLEQSLIDNKELNTKYNVKVPSLEECMEKFHKKLKTASLLEILYEIIKVAGELRYSWKFNALMAAFAHLLEVICDSFIIKHLPPSSSTKIATILREILYSRPSPVVVYQINRCLTKAVKLDGFIKTLCHNSDPETFVKFEEDVYFKRGSCMLQTLCLLMDLTVDETCWDAPYELIRWVNFVLMEEKVTARTWFELKNGFRVKRCFCLQALTNLVIKIVHRAVTFYISRLTLLPDDENFTSEFQLKMEEILHAGLEIVGQMVNIDILSFVRSIRTSYQMYEKFLEQLESVHLNNDTFAGFKLTPNNYYLLQKLLSTRRISEKILEETDVKGCRFKKSNRELKDNPADLSDFYKNNKSWPSDRFKPETSEENNKEEWTLW